jgi:hypothetical protein
LTLIANVLKRLELRLHVNARYTKRIAALVWASPITLIGVVFAIIIRATGGQIRKHGIAWEASNGAAFRLLFLLNPWQKIAAITFGHIIIARDTAIANQLRAHEHAHVRQTERWGLFFPLAYLVASIVAWARGGDAYLDNGFEIEARMVAADAGASGNCW